MQEEKNNAVEKAENAQTAPNKSAKKKASPKKSGAKKSTATAKSKTAKAKKSADKKHKTSFSERMKERKQARKAKSNEAKIRKQEIAAERERVRAEKRIEAAKIKAERKKEKEKAKQLKQREKNKHSAEIKKLKEEKRAEKAARRETLKNETKAQRHKRIAAEKKEKLELRREKRRLKAELRKEKLEAKKAKRSSKQKNKTRGFGGWLAAVISLGVTVLVLSSVLTMTMFVPTETDNALSGVYEKSYYDTVSYVNNMDLGLSKTLSTKDSGARQKYLLDLAVNSELAENDINRLPLHDEAKFYTTKLINQIGDFSKYLMNKLIDGEELSDKDVAALRQLYVANRELKNALAEISATMGDGYDFSKLADNDNTLAKGMEELQNLSVEYPELIYDGPFSDGRETETAKGLSGEEIAPEAAKKIFTEIFNDFGITDIENAGETEGKFACYNFTAKSDKAQLYAQITKKGGRLIMFNCFEDCHELNYDAEDLIPVAKEFLTAAGFENMEAVWVSSADAVTSINFAYEQDGVIVYSDLVKVTVCQQTGRVTGLEASGYLMNHTVRTIGEAEISKAVAKTKIADELEVVGTRTTLIPVGNSAEKLAYEFKCVADGELYYAYIDAVTGKQLELFKVISTGDGLMLM